MEEKIFSKILPLSNTSESHFLCPGASLKQMLFILTATFFY